MFARMLKAIVIQLWYNLQLCTPTVYGNKRFGLPIEFTNSTKNTCIKTKFKLNKHRYEKRPHLNKIPVCIGVKLF